jgi:RNA polymerase sigma factor (sigma-70 family)
MLTGYTEVEPVKREIPPDDPEQRESEWLAEQAKLGDTEAFGELMRRHRSHAYKWAKTMTEDGHLAEDIVQEAFMKAFLHIGSLVDSKRFLGWLKRIVRNQSLMRIRRGGPFRHELPFSSLVRQPEADSADGHVDWGDLESILHYMTRRNSSNPVTDPAERLIRQETMDLITSLLYCLNRKERAMFESYFFKQWSPEEISLLFQTTTRTVYSSIQRSKLKVREEHAKGVWQIGDRRRLPGKEGIMKLLKIDGIQQVEAAYSLLDRLAKMIRAAGVECSICKLMAETGFAFRTKISHRTTYADGAFVFDWMSTVRSALGRYGLSPQFLYGQLPVLHVPLGAVIETFPIVREEPDVIAGFVRRFIDTGSPVLVFDTYVKRPFVHEWNLIYGYDDKQGEVYMTANTAPYTKTLTYLELAQIPLRFLCGIEPKRTGTAAKQAPNPAASTLPHQQRKQWTAVLLQAVQMSKKGDGFVFASGFLSYASGLNAYDTWISHVEQDESSSSKYGHKYLAHVYADARRHASGYIRLMAEQMDSIDGAETLKELLLQAADAYTRAADALSMMARMAPLFPDRAHASSAHAGGMDVVRLLKQAQEAEGSAMPYISSAILFLEQLEECQS